MAENAPVAPKKDGGLLWWIIIPLVMVFIAIMAAVAGSSILTSNYLLGSLNSQSGVNGALSANCKDIPAAYNPYFNEAGSKYGVSPALIAAMAKQESGFNPSAVSGAGAGGIIQFMPATWAGWSHPGMNKDGTGPWITDPADIAKYGGYGTDASGDGVADPFNAEDNINSSAKYMANLLQSHNNDLNEALGSYNGGADWHGKPESVDYVQKVTGYYEGYKTCLTGGVASSAECQALGSKAAELAISKIGSTYTQDAGLNIGPISFDCAGLFGWSWWEASGEQWNDLHHSGVPSFTKDLDYYPLNSAADLQPGDAVFKGAHLSSNESNEQGRYDGSVSPIHDYNHMGIYVGGGQVVEAKGRAWGVIESSFTNPSSPWAKEFGRPKKCPSTAAQTTPSVTSPVNLNIVQKPLPNLEKYKKQIQEYSKNHYHKDTWQITPTLIILHYTATSGFPTNLNNGVSAPDSGYTYSSNGPPPVTTHYVVNGSEIDQILPDNVMDRGAYGVNYTAISIEIVAANESALANNQTALQTVAKLTKSLMNQYGISLNKVYGHYQVGNGTVPEYLNYKPNSNVETTAQQDYAGSGQGRTDPGVANLQTIKTMIQNIK